MQDTFHCVTNPMGKIPKVIALFALLFAPSIAKAQTATIDWMNVHQQIQGFGAADQLGFFANQALTTTQADLFFSTTSGAGLSIMREPISEGAGSAGGADCSTVSANCVSSVTLGNMQLAVARGARIFATPWSPPASMKTNGSLICDTGSGNSSLSAGSYPAYATWLSNYVKTLTSLYSIPVYALSIQNEPEICPTYYEGAIWSAQNIHDFVKNNLGPTMAAAGLSNTLIALPESNILGDLGTYGNMTFNDPAAASYVGIAATHNYDYGTSSGYPNAQNLGKQLWQTEMWGCDVNHYVSGASCPFINGMTDGLYWAQRIHNWLVSANGNAWLYWALIPFPVTNEGLMASDGTTVAKRLWVMGNWSRFVRPGYYRIGATSNPQSGVYVSAFQNASTGSLVIVAINNSGSDLSQSFSIANGPDFTSVTPWITSSSLSLAQQSAVSVSTDSFTYTLPAASITTLVGSAVSSTAAPAPPIITSVVIK
jgi:glucuronoarabinoxylan endo-1,4-beta-xylanase